MKTVLLALLVLPVLAGCATQAQRQYEQNIHNYNAALTSWQNCKKPIKESPVAHRLREILILDNDDPRTVEKLALKRYVTEQEAKDIIDYLARMRPCRKLSIEGFSKVHPEYVATLARLYSEVDAAKVINHELTIGVANQRIVDRGNQVSVEFSQIGQRIESQLNQAHQYELAQRRIAQQELQKWNYQQQVLANQRRALANQQQINSNNLMNQTIQSLNMNRNRNRFTTTNCTYWGNTLNCTHY